MINIKDIPNINVLHTSFDLKGELVDNFEIVDVLLTHIEQLQAEQEQSARALISIMWISTWTKRMILEEMFPKEKTDG